MILRLGKQQQSTHVTNTLESEIMEKLVSAAIENSKLASTLDTISSQAITRGYGMMKITSTGKAVTVTPIKEEIRMTIEEILSEKSDQKGLND